VSAIEALLYIENGEAAVTLRLGVIGTGGIGKDHIRRCNQVLSGASVVAVADADAAAAARAIAEVCPDARVHASGQALIRAAEVDAIIVTSWGLTHEAFVLEAIAAGKSVFCEKPLATTAAACRTIVEAEMRHGKRLVQVGFMRPYDEGYRALQAVVAGGQIGAPLMVHCAHRNASVPESYTTEMAITDTLVHELDVLRWLLDDDYISCQAVFPRKSPHAAAHLRDPQIIMLPVRIRYPVRDRRRDRDGQTA
jgi:myo-inositol 2-dehydrogenase/D-chiro-inositol 1-dehydrogenase